MNSETKAIIGGSVAGGVIVIILLTIGIYFIFRRKKQKKRKDYIYQTKPRPISPHVSPNHSQPSSLGHVPEARLPKVNSTGLWIGTPSVYAMGPAHAYHYGRPNGVGKPGNMPIHIPRAISESRLPQRMPSGGGQRIYHSQQLAPVFEHPRHSGMEVYDVYQFAGGSRSKMVETKYSPYYHHEEFRLDRKPQRSQSDAQANRSKRPEVRRDANRKYRSPSNESKKRRQTPPSRQSSKRSNEINEMRGSRNFEAPAQTRVVTTVREENAAPSVHVNRAYSPDTGEVVRAPPTKPRPTSVPASSYTSTSHTGLPNGSAGVTSSVVSSSTHSQTVVTEPNLSASATDSMKLLAKNKTDDQKTSAPEALSIHVDSDEKNNDIGGNHYVFKDDVYTLPDKSKVIIDEEEKQNPIITRMKEMVIEKSRSSNPNSPREDNVEQPNFVDGVNERDNKQHLSVDVIKDRSPSPDIYILKEQLSPRLSSDGEAHEDLNKAGKRITESAFDFLDNYLSDDEGTVSHIGSPPVSPGGLRAIVD